MPIEWWQILLAAAGIHAMAALLLAVRTAESRAGGWAIALGVLLAIHAAAMAGAQLGFERLNAAWWLSYVLLPGLFLPLMIAVANIGLLRQWLFALNALFWLAAVGLGVWLLRDLTPVDAVWGHAFALPEQFHWYLIWAGVLSGLALLDTALQWGRARTPRQSRRMGNLWFVLLLLGLGWGLDGWVLMGQEQLLGVQLLPPSFALFLLAHLTLFILLWLQKGPRRIGATLPASLIHDSRQPLLIADSDGRVQAVNPAAASVLEQRRNSMLGKELREVIGLDADYLDTVTRLHGAGYVERIQVQVKSLKTLRELAVQPLILRAGDGEVLALVCSLSPGSDDPTLAVSSLLDPVTGLAGAALGEALIEQELRRHAGGSGPLVAAIFVRLDDTGVIATRHGQAVHDRLQNSVKERLDAVCDWPLDLARAAGGGYLLLLTQVTDREEVLAIAERTQELLDQPFTLDDDSLQPPAAVTVIPDLRVYHDLVDVLDDARHGLERARHTPGEPYVAGQRAEERTTLALALEAAIAADGLDLVLQPVVDLRNARAVGVRVQLRWSPEGMPPLEDGALRRLARRVHLEGPINQWRLRQLASMRFPKAWAVWLPVSVEELQTPAFVRAFPKSLTRLPFKLILELPDTVWQLPACRKIASDLCQAGMGLHGQDFSVGARMLTHAAGLVPRTVSLDARLVQLHSPVADAAVKGQAETARVMGAALRGDGVRKKVDVKRLRSLGVPLATGEYLAAAMSATALLAWLADDSRLQASLDGTEPATAVDTQSSRRRPSID